MIRNIRYGRFVAFLGIVLLILLYGPIAVAQPEGSKGKPVPARFCITQDVMDIYNRINDYRRANDLPPIPLSRSLCHVASLHVKDLALHHPDQGSCNFHSWSAFGSWKPFCYPKDENKKNSVWDKPREITKYPVKAYEIVYWQNTRLVPDTVLMVWQSEDYFNSFLLNTGKWAGKPWGAIGIAIGENYASAWFGEAEDPEGSAWVCGTTPPKPVKDTLNQPAAGKKPPSAKPASESKPRLVKKAEKAMKPVDSVAIARPDTTAVKVTAIPVQPDSIPKTWCIIVKTNLTEDAANKLVEKLRATDYPAARVITRDNKIRVSVFESRVKSEIVTMLKEVKKIYKDAWLYKY